MGLFAELQRRNVVRVALAYVVLAWVLLQIGDLLLDLLGVPGWGLRLVFGILALGFPVALSLAWIYELTPDGLRRDTGTTADPAYADRTGRRLSIAVIVLLLIAISITLSTHFTPEPAATTSPQITTASAPVELVAPARQASIAILPFSALSEDASDAFFGKGIAEELLNALARFPDLKVAARTSAFAFEGQSVNLQEIGERLGVRHVLEGSVRRAGNRLRISVQLTRAEDGFNEWSESYDRTVTDIFAIQDEIVEAVSRQLQVRLGVGAGAGRADRGDLDPRAYEQYLQGLAFWGERDNPPSNRLDAIAAFRLATQIAPDFADAWAALGNAYIFSAPDPLGLDADEFLARSSETLRQALILDEVNAAAHAGMAVLKGAYLLEFDAAEHHLAQALSLGPNVAAAHYAASQYFTIVGDVERALDGYDRALVLDPLNASIRRNRAIFLVVIGRIDEGIRFFDECARTRCLEGGYEFFAVSTMIIMGDGDRARQWLDEAPLFQQLRALPEAQQPAVFRSVVAVVDFVAGGSPEPMLADLPSESQPLSFPGLLGPLFARAIDAAGQGTPDPGQITRLLEGLTLSHEAHQLISEPFSLAPYYGTVIEYPAWVLKDPRYHALWSRPGLAELARIRRENGFDAGLPVTARQQAP